MKSVVCRQRDDAPKTEPAARDLPRSTKPERIAQIWLRASVLLTGPRLGEYRSHSVSARIREPGAFVSHDECTRT